MLNQDGPDRMDSVMAPQSLCLKAAQRPHDQFFVERELVFHDDVNDCVQLGVLAIGSSCDGGRTKPTRLARIRQFEANLRAAAVCPDRTSPLNGRLI
jgi:hypothetical protein